MEGMKYWGDTAVAGLNSNATRTVRGAISFNSCTHFPPSAGSLIMKPVMLPPGCAIFAAKPLPTGSDTPVNTMGIVLVSRARAAITGVVTPKIALGRRPTSPFAKVLILSASPALQRSSIRRLLPSVHPSFESAPRNTASQDCATRSLCALPTSTPISRTRSGCCARAASGHAAAPPSSEMNSRLFSLSKCIRLPRSVTLEVGVRLVTTMPVDVVGHQVLGLANARRVGALNPANWPAPNCHALHETPLRIVVVDGIVLGRPVIPHRNGMRRPVMPELILGNQCLVKQRVE